MDEFAAFAVRSHDNVGGRSEAALELAPFVVEGPLNPPFDASGADEQKAARGYAAIVRFDEQFETRCQAVVAVLVTWVDDLQGGRASVNRSDKVKGVHSGELPLERDSYRQGRARSLWKVAGNVRSQLQARCMRER